MPLYDHWPDVAPCRSCASMISADADTCEYCGAWQLVAPLAGRETLPLDRDSAIRYARAGAMPLLNRGDYRGAFQSFERDVSAWAGDLDRAELARGAALLTSTSRTTVLAAIRAFIVEYE